MEKYLKYKKKYLEYKHLIGGNTYTSNIITYLKEKSNDIYNDFNNDEIFESFNLNELFITHDLKTIKDIYESNRYLQIRKYNNEKKLIIACGNRRLDNSNLDPCDYSQCNLINKNIHHSHAEAFTIDMSLVANPSIIAEFKKDIIFRTIPDNSFDIIIFEGGGEPSDNPDEIKRLLNKNNMSFCIYNNEKGKYIIYSYWSKGTYYIN
jgi:hypothetical protein